MTKAARLAFASILLLILVAAPTLAQSTGSRTFSLSQGSAVVGIGSGTVPGLIRVNLGFRNGDHHVRLISARPAGTGAFRVSLEDSGGEDPVNVSFRWADLWRYDTPRLVASNACAGTCRLFFPPIPAGHTLVLAGFEVRNTESGSSDRHVRELAVRPVGHLGYVDVTFTDDSGIRPFAASVYYLVLPPEATTQSGSIVGSVHSGGVSSIVRTWPGLAVLTSFRFRFASGDRHLERFGIDLSGDLLQTAWHDGNKDDPYSYWVKYVVLRP